MPLSHPKEIALNQVAQRMWVWDLLKAKRYSWRWRLRKRVVKLWRSVRPCVVVAIADWSSGHER